MTKMMAPNTRITWYPANAFADPENPTIVELNAGTNISRAVVTGYTLGFTDSDTDDSKSIVDEGNVQNRGFSNYEASLQFFRKPIGATDAESLAYEAARSIFKGEAHVEGWLTARQGYKWDVPFAADHKVSLFKVLSDYYRNISADGGAPILFEVPFLQQGEAYPNVEVAA